MFTCSAFSPESRRARGMNSPSMKRCCHWSIEIECLSHKAEAASALRLLIEPEFIADGIGECGECAHSWADCCAPRQDSATRSLYALEGVGNAIDHDVRPH